MRIALSQINVIIGQFDAMQLHYRRAWEAARREGADLLVLPELATTGYPPRDLLTSRAFVEGSLALLRVMQSWTASGPAILCGAVLPNRGEGNDFFNAAVLLAGGAEAGVAHKSLLPTYDVFDEHRYFEPARARGLLELGGVKLGVTICEDIWVDSVPTTWSHTRYETDPCAELAARGADIFINISASPFTLGKGSRRRSLVAETARRHGVWMVYVNQVGGHDELLFDGHSLVVDPCGQVTARLAGFAEDFAIVDIPPTPPVGHGHVEHVEEIAACEPEELYRALVMGLRDYVHKSGFRQALLGLSGGIDSAVTAVLAADALGAENVWGVAMPTRYSSDHSVEDAERLARLNDIRYDIIPIDAAFQAILDQLAPHFAGRAVDLTEENLQARLRAVTLMALSNKFGGLLLSTSNKSEAAVGYTTLYGDMSGALAVLADVCKTRVYALARWLNRSAERIPTRSIDKPPSAELRPNQTDQDSLPPYEVVDRVLEGYVERLLSPDDIAQEYGIDAHTVLGLVRLMNRSEYKRRQAPPALKVTDKAFGVGRRMPIVAHHG